MHRRLQLFLRALRLRCPHCGEGRIFRHWFSMHTHCPACGLSLAVGNRVGAYVLNLVVAEFVLMIVLAIIVLRTWPDPPYDALQYLAPALMLITPLLFYPFSKAIFVAIDLAMHPHAQPDVRVHGVGDDGEQ